MLRRATAMHAGEMSTPISLWNGYDAATSSGLPLPQPRSMKADRVKSMARPSSGSLMDASLVVS